MQFLKRLIRKLPLYVFIGITQLFQMAGLFVISMIYQKPIECIMIYIGLVLCRNLFGKSFHATSYWVCTGVSWLSFWLLTAATLPISVSIFCPLLMGTGLAYFMHHFAYYLELRKFKEDKALNGMITLFKGMDVELLEETAIKKGLNSTEIKYLKWKYCDRLKDEEIAHRMNYSVSRARDYVNMAKQKFNNTRI